MLPSVVDLLGWDGNRPPLPDTDLSVAVAVRACADYIGVDLTYDNLVPAGRGEWALCAFSLPILFSFSENDDGVIVVYGRRGISIPPSLLWRQPAAVEAAFAALFYDGGDTHD